MEKNLSSKERKLSLVKRNGTFHVSSFTQWKHYLNFFAMLETNLHLTAISYIVEKEERLKLQIRGMKRVLESSTHLCAEVDFHSKLLV